MDFYKKAKAQMKDLQDEFGDKINLGGNKGAASTTGSTAGSTTGSAAPASAAPSSAATGSSNAATPATSTAGGGSAAVLAVPPNDTSGAPAAKLPLTARKSIRDDFDAKKPAAEAAISKTMGTPWTIHVDFPNIYSYAMDEGSEARVNPGRSYYRYFEGAVSQFDRFVKKYGDDGRNQLNAVAYHHVITLEPALNGEVTYAQGCDVSGGKFRCLFRKADLGANSNDACADMDKAVTAAAAKAEADSGSGAGPALNLAAKSSIRTKYEPGIGAVQDKARALLANPTLEFVPNFEANFAAVMTYVNKEGDRDMGSNWDDQFGVTVLEYFEGAVRQLEHQKFGGDDMLQEGFAEAVEKNEIQMRVVEKLEKRTYNECVIEGGVLYLQTTPKYWRSNVNDAAQGVVDML